jgi:hypothetical protein
MSNSKQFNHNLQKAKRQQQADRDNHSDTNNSIDNYLYWLFNTSTEPLSEVEFLINTIKESNNRHVIEEVLLEFIDNP